MQHSNARAATDEGGRRRSDEDNAADHSRTRAPASAGTPTACRRPKKCAEGQEGAAAAWVAGREWIAESARENWTARAPHGWGRTQGEAQPPVDDGEALCDRKGRAERLRLQEVRLHTSSNCCREAGARPRCRQQPRGGFRGYQTWPVVVWASYLLLLQCQGFRQAGAGPHVHTCSAPERSRSYASMSALKTVPSLPVLRVEPEYTCVYEAGVRDRHQIGSARTYAQFLSTKLRSKVTGKLAGPPVSAVGIIGEGTGGGASSDVAAKLSLRDGMGSLGMLAQEAPLDPFAGSWQQDEQWREDVGQRYRELIPPSHPHSGSTSRCMRSTHRMMSAEDLRKAAEQALSTSHSLSWTPVGEKQDLAGRDKVEEAVLVLDLDKCCFYGSDGNDLGIALQWMEKGPKLVQELYRHLLNPQVKETYARLRQRAKCVRVVIYTMRATFLVYHSCFRDRTVPLRWNPDWHHGAQVC